MKIREDKGVTYVLPEDDFDLERIFECGQCFRWNADENGAYTGVAFGKALRIFKEGDEFAFICPADEFRGIWYDYFDMGRSYCDIRKKVAIDDYMVKASEFGAGIRILKQDRWEALCSFIISQCNNIPRIKKIVETLCRSFGDEIEYLGKTYYSFPSAERLAKIEAEELAPLRCGYRAPYIIGAARAVASGELDLERLASDSPENALKALKALNGVGDKVANCVVLFGLMMLNAFPLDVWMKRAVKEHYGENFDPNIFAPYAGIAQQYMFYYARSGEEN